ncbi:DUF1206 domain-containing protein [Actinomycetospora sp. CA-084318]|uniref:DUF1206 domain-containing protein n=1 Tax=Actinomycetospora sp. CA-084318 TaxID=3239892 RepID=UPI003D96A243
MSILPGRRVPEGLAPPVAPPVPAPDPPRPAGRLRRAAGWLAGGGGDAGPVGVELLGRGGLVAYGALHLVLAGLAVVLMRGSPTVHADQGGAIAVVAGLGPVGALLLGVAVLGLAAFGVWQVRAALVGFGWVSGGERFRKRVGATGKAIAMFSMATLAVPPAIGPLRGPPPGGPPAPSAPHAVSDLVARLFALPEGRFVVAVAAVVALGMAVGMCWTGLHATYLGDLHADRLTPWLRRTALVAGSYGNLARAVLTGSVGVLFAAAALTDDPRRSGGFTQAMWFIEGAGPFGTVALVGVSGGLAAYGVYCFVDAYARRA